MIQFELHAQKPGADHPWTVLIPPYAVRDSDQWADLAKLLVKAARERGVTVDDSWEWSSSVQYFSLRARRLLQSSTSPS